MAPSSATDVGETATVTSVSLFVMVRTADDGVPRSEPPVGLLRVMLTVSFPSGTASLQMVMLKVFDVSPAAKFKVPEVNT